MGVRVEGRLRIYLRLPNGGRRKIAESRNLVVNDGLDHIADQLAGQQEAPMSHMALGSSGTAPAATDTALGGETGRVALDSKSKEGPRKVVYQATFPAGTATGTCAEAGIFNASSGGVMLARATYEERNKGASDEYEVTWQLDFSAS